MPVSSSCLPKGLKKLRHQIVPILISIMRWSCRGRISKYGFQVKSLKENWANYNKEQNSQTNPDSLYNRIGEATAITLSGDKDYYIKVIPSDILARYNADLGKSYLLTLLDVAATKHYKYALLITLQKNHTGSIMVVCFTNEKGPEFFRKH